MERRISNGWKDIHLSKNFTLGEFTISARDPALLIDFVPSIEQVTKIGLLCTFALQPARNKFGTIRITSGITPIDLNTARGGVPDSQHVYGEAADFIAEEARTLDVFLWLKEVLGFPGELFYYESKGHCHVALPVIWVTPQQKIIVT